MDFSIFEEDSYFNEINRYAGWLKDSTPIDLIEFAQNDAKPDNLNDQAIPYQKIQAKEPFDQDQIVTQTAIQDFFNQNQQIPDNLNHTDVNDSKYKKISKSKKHDQMQSTQINHFQSDPIPSATLQTKPKSKYNNMAGFLIGTFSQILSVGHHYRFDDGWLKIYLNGKWINLEEIDCYDVLEIEKLLASLKNKIFHLPRKDGAKKHLFNLINFQPSDSQETSICKCIIRKQLIQGLGQEFWLEEHVKSRDFKPQNDDVSGTKKKKRHEDYLAYLRAVKCSLQARGCIPKRIQM